MNPIYESGIQFIQALQTMSPTLDSVMNLFTFLGRFEFYLILIPFIYWVVSAKLGFRVLLVLLTSDFLGLTFKQLLHQPRPYWIGDVQALGVEPSYGIPSIHASDSLAVWGYLAYRLNKAWLWVVTFLMVMMISLSRMYLGVHFPTDVIGGWLSGLVAIFLVVKGETWFPPYLKKQPPGMLIGIGFLASIVMLLLGWLAALWIASSPDPAEWARYSTQARSISYYFSLAGGTFGIIAGYTLMRQYAPFQTKGSWVKRIGRYLLGMAGVFVVYYGLGVFFEILAPDESALGSIFRYILIGTVTFWILFGAPWVFLRLRLAEPEGG